MTVGDILYIKTTGEAVTVLTCPDDPTHHGVEVRRATSSKDDGITHKKDYFYTYELEGEEAKFDRELQGRLLEYNAMMKFTELTKPNIKGMPHAN